MLKIAITTTSFAQYDQTPLELLKEKGLEVIMNPFARKLKEEEIIKLCADASGIIAGTEKFEAKTLEKLPNLKVISRCGTGIENIDTEAAKKLGIKILNTPDAPAIAVSELTVGLVLAILRRIPETDAAIKSGRWEKITGNLLRQKKVGIIGFGRIGRKVAELLKVFGCEIAYSDPNVKDGILELKNLSKEKLLSWADIILLHVAGKERILEAGDFKLIKNGSWLVNTSRGEAIDEDALYQALKNGTLKGACLDVFTQEPYSGPLRELGNVILTAHIGSYAQESRIEMEKQAVENLIGGLIP